MIRRILGGLFGKFWLWDAASARVIKAGTMLLHHILCMVFTSLRIQGTFYVNCFDPGGKLKWSAIAPNAVTNQGLNHILNVVLCSATQITAWYMGLVDNASFSAFAAGDTHASHGGWIELTAYSESTRVAWTTVTSTAQSVTNTSTSNFTINATKTIKGLFITDDSTKGGSSGSSKILSEAAFSGGNQSASSGDVIQATYTLNAASS